VATPALPTALERKESVLKNDDQYESADDGVSEDWFGGLFCIDISADLCSGCFHREVRLLSYLTYYQSTFVRTSTPRSTMGKSLSCGNIETGDGLPSVPFTIVGQLLS